MNQTSIEWTDRTWNPLTGCTKVSPGCDHCYAKTMHERFNGPGSFDTVTLHPERLDQPLRWRKPSMVFVNSMSDLFHKDVPDQFIVKVWATMALSRHTFQVLTKRPARMRALLSSAAFNAEFRRIVCATNASVCPDDGVPVQNVWLGVSVENQQWANIRIPALLNTPAAVRFLSCEPLLGPVDLLHSMTVSERLGTDIDWCIVGGESGHGARPMHPLWARSLQQQCRLWDIKFLFKQWGEWAPENPEAPGFNGIAVLSQMPNYPDARMVRVGKKAAGRHLDGRTWDEYPAGAA